MVCNASRRRSSFILWYDLTTTITSNTPFGINLKIFLITIRRRRLELLIAKLNRSTDPVLLFVVFYHVDVIIIDANRFKRVIQFESLIGRWLRIKWIIFKQLIWVLEVTLILHFDLFLQIYLLHRYFIWLLLFVTVLCSQNCCLCRTSVTSWIHISQYVIILVLEPNFEDGRWLRDSLRA